MTTPSLHPGETGAVTASSQSAVDAAKTAFRAGGNAVDAAVTAALASCVADTCNTGLGGYGGHLIIAPADGDAVCVDFNAWHPEHRREDLYAHPEDASGPLASCIPNVVAGLSRALSAHGGLRWKEACGPAIELAETGVAMNGTTGEAFAEVSNADFVDSCFRFFESDGNTLFRQPALARTLEDLADQGPDWFYEGPVAEAACAAWQQAGRNLTRADWAAARDAVSVEPAPTVRIGDVELALAPLGTSGSVSAAATMAAGARLLRKHEAETPETITAWTERIAGAWAYRLATAEGNHFDDNTSLEAWIHRALAFAPAATLDPVNGHTCHLNTMDADGTMVSLTLTHGPRWFGARWVVPGTGIIMNGGMGLFRPSTVKQHDGRLHAVTNMSPTVARDGNGNRLAIGCPGGKRIPTNAGLVLARHFFGGQPIQQAVSAGRMHADTSQSAGIESSRLPAGSAESLASRFDHVHEEDWRLYFGPLTAIRRTSEDKIELGLDDRPTRGYGACGRT